MQTAEQAIRAVVASGHTLTVYDDYSSEENAAFLDQLHDELGISVIHISDHIDHPSPNYRWVLIHAQQQAVAHNAHLLIIESDVIVRPDTISRLQQAVSDSVGMVAAVTVNEEGEINFPYEYGRRSKPTGNARNVSRFVAPCSLWIC